MSCVADNEVKVFRLWKIGVNALIVGIVLQSPIPAGAQISDTAQPPGVATADDQNADIIVTAPRYREVVAAGGVGILGQRDTFDTPFSVQTYTSALMESRQARGLTDIADFNASITAVGRGTGNEYLNIRGFLVGANTQYDGLNLPASGTTTPELYERFELLKGPSAVLSQNIGSIGGNFNLVPKRAGARDLTNFTTSASSDSLFRAHADISRRFGAGAEFGVRVNLIGATGNTPYRFEHRKLFAAMAAFDYTTDRLTVSAVFDYLRHQIRGNAGFIGAIYNGVGEVPVPDPRRYSSIPFRYSDEEMFRGLVSFKYKVTDDWTLYAKVGRLRTDSTILGLYGGKYDETGLASAIFPYLFPSRNTQTSAEAGVRGKIRTGPLTHEIVISLISDKTNNPASETDYDPIALNVFDPGRGPFSLAASDPYSFGSTQSLKSIAVADIISVFDDRLSVVLGGRRQTVKTGSSFEGVSDPSYSKSVSLPSAGIVVKPLPWISLYANYSKGINYGTTAPPGTENANQVLPPEQSKQKEIGAKFNLGPLAVTAAAFDIERSLAIQYLNPATGLDRYGYVGSQVNRGVELEAFGDIVKGLQVIGGIALLDAKLKHSENGLNEGNEVPGAPKFVGKAAAEWELPFLKRASLNVQYVHTSRQQANIQNTQTLKAWDRVDLGARYTFSKTFTIYARIDNLFNSRYWESVNPRNYYSVGAPRTWLVSTQFHF